MDGAYTHKEDDRTAYILVSDENYSPMPSELIVCDH